MKDFTYFIIVLIIILTFSLLNSMNRSENFETNENSDLKKVERPFVNIYDQNGTMLNVALLSRPFYAPNHYTDYEKIKEKYLILGISSYQEFPNQPRNPKDNYNNDNIYDSVTWTNMCEGWLHCFKDKDKYIPKTMKSTLLSESDFIDCNIHVPNKDVKKKYDFIYICHRDDLNDCSTKEWVAYNKNLDLANKCFEIMCKKYHLKGLLIGRSGCSLPKGCEKYLETTPKLGYYDLVKKYDEAKFIFIPNVHDASPRVLTEALCHDVSCLVNNNIVGGWKYVSDESGMLFDDINNFEEKLKIHIKNLNNYKPRNFYIENYGILNAGKKLRDFCVDIFGDRLNIDADKLDYITPEFPKESYKRCELA